MSIKWSLITVSYNSADILPNHWSQPLPPGVEWIVVDNASKDNSAEVAAQLGARVIRSETNLGFGGANNLGYEAAQGRIIAFVNPDIKFDPASFEVLESALGSSGEAIVSPQLIYPDGVAQPSARGLPTIIDKVLARLGNASARKRFYVTASSNETKEVAWVIGAAVIGFRQTFDKLGKRGPWDAERFFVYYEDIDLSFRAWKAGISVRLVGTARWIHSWARATSGSFSFAPWKHELQGMWAFYTRYPSTFLGLGLGCWWRPLARHRWDRPLAEPQEYQTHGKGKM